MREPSPVGNASARVVGDRWWRAAVWIAVALGVVLRCRRFACDRSLWGDETLLALNVVGRSWLQLVGPLAQGQAAPIGFLWLEKLAVTCFGASELALRVVPLLAGVAALLLFRRVAHALLTPAAALFAVLFFAIAEPQVGYSAAVKQYSCDVFVAVLLLDGAIRLARSPAPPRRAWIAFAVIGGAAQLLSHAAVLVEAAVGGVLLLQAWRERPQRNGRSWQSLRAPLAVVAAWLVCFGALYFVSLRDTIRNPFLHGFWAGAYAPFPPLSGADLAWYPTRFFGYFSDPLGATPAWLAAAFMLCGVVRRPERGGGRLLLAGSLLSALFASALGCYPFSTGLDADLGSGRFNWNGRLLLFTTPSVLLIVAGGLDWLADRFAAVGRGAALVAAATLLAVPGYDAVRNFVAPPSLQEIGPAVAFVRDHLEPGDRIFVRAAASPGYRFYARQEGLSIPSESFELTATPEGGDLRSRVAALPIGRRLFVFHVDGLGEGPEFAARRVPAMIGRVAAEVDSFTAERVHVWIFKVDGGLSWRMNRGRQGRVARRSRRDPTGTGAARRRRLG